MKYYRQCSFESYDNDKKATIKTTAWVPEPVKKGMAVTLETSDDPTRLWNVLSVSDTRITQAEADKNIKAAKDHHKGDYRHKLKGLDL